MSLHFKSGVKWDGMAPQLALALTVASECYGEQGEDCLITSLVREGSLHVLGRAADLSVRRFRGGEMIPPEKMDLIVAALEARLGRSGGGPFDVVDERLPGSSPHWNGSHIHIEFQPKEGFPNV